MVDRTTESTNAAKARARDGERTADISVPEGGPSSQPSPDGPSAPPHHRATVAERIEQVAERKAEALQGGGPQAIERQHARGKLTARERLELLLDPGSFVETDTMTRHRFGTYGLDNQRPYTDGVVTGWGTIDGRKVFVFSQDFTIFGGSLREVFAEKVCQVRDLAAATGAPVLGINDSGGARIQEGSASLAGYGYIFDRNVRASGVIPQISVIMGPCAGGAVYSPAITDFIFMVKGTSNMFITGPDVIKAVTGEAVTFEELGGATTHATRSGIAGFIADDEQHCLQMVRYLMSFLPQNNMEDPPTFATSDPPDRQAQELVDLMPDEPNKAYDMHDVIKHVFDDGDFFEVFPHYAQNILTGFARLNGHAVGIVANQPMHLAGVLDIHSSEKAARFVRFCDPFNIPPIVFVDVPGFLPGTNQEWGRIIRRGAKLLFAFSEATVPRMQVITRKAYGGAYVVMNSKSIRADVAFAWPTAEIAVMGAEGAVNIVSRKEIDKAEDKKGKRAELIADYTEKFANPYVAAERGYVDDVIDPRETRPRLINALEMLLTKRETLAPRKHGNIPL